MLIELSKTEHASSPSTSHRPSSLRHARLLCWSNQLCCTLTPAAGRISQQHSTSTDKRHRSVWLRSSVGRIHPLWPTERDRLPQSGHCEDCSVLRCADEEFVQICRRFGRNNCNHVQDGRVKMEPVRILRTWVCRARVSPG
jgi:hypothetical protein